MTTSDPVQRAAEAVPEDGVEFHVLSDEEMRELDETPSTEYMRNIGLHDPRVPEVEEVEDDEVTEDNYERFLPVYTDDNPPHINVLALANKGLLIDTHTQKLRPNAQAEYDQDPPAPQESFEDSEGV